MFLGRSNVSISSSLGGGAAGFTNTNSLSMASVNAGYVVAYDATNFNFTTTMSASVWFKHSGIAAVSTVFSQYNNTGFVGKWLMQMQADGKIQAGLDSGSGDKIYRTVAAYDDGAWHHFAFTWGSSGTLKIYVDGSEITGASLTLVLNDSFTSLASVSNKLAFGGRWVSATDEIASSFSGGLIDEPSLWSVELSSTDISNIYNSGSPGDLSDHAQAANLVGWWRCGDDASDTVNAAIDQVNSNDGVGKDTGNITLSTDAP